MKKIYLVTQGSYSDYSVMGVFTTEEKAEQFIEAFTDKIYNDGASVEVYELNQGLSKIEKGYKPFYVSCDRDGSMECGVKSSPFPEAGKSRILCTRYPDGDRLKLQCYVWAKTDEHAIKHAGDLRARLIAENLWAKGWSQGWDENLQNL